jgi:hypothetical protein
MAFLDNSGDIILDAVLTDTGRYRLAKGDGTFKIAKFALGDDEINYGLFQGTHASGSAYYDLQILRSPVLEAFTNNGSSMKSKLVTITRNNLLFLPSIKLNNVQDNNKMSPTHGMWIVAANTQAEAEMQPGLTTGFLKGVTGGTPTSNSIKIDQGLDTDQISPVIDLDTDLVETQYNVQIDNRLGKIYSPTGTFIEPSFIDDDQIATYYYTTTNSAFVSSITTIATTPQTDQVITGPRGTSLTLRVRSTAELQTSDYLFNTLGSSGNTIAGTTGGANYKIIDTFIRVQGVKTGASIDIPVRFIKNTA